MMRKTCFPATAILSLAVPILAAGLQTVIENFENEVFAIRDVNLGAPARGTNTLSARISNRTGTERILAIDIRTECFGFGMTNQQRPTFFRLQPKESRDIRIEYQIATPLLGRMILRAGESDTYVDIDDWQALPESARSKIPLPDPRYVWRQVVFPKPVPGREAAVRDLVSAHDIDLQWVSPESLARLKAALPGRLAKARNEDNALRTRLSKLFRLDRDCPREFDFQNEGWGDRSAYMSRIFENYGVRVEAFSISGERGGRISSFFATRKGSGTVKKPLILLLSGNPPGTKESSISAAVFFSLLGYHAVGLDRRPEARTLDTKEKFLNNWADPVFDAHRTIDFLVSQDRYAVSGIGIYGLSAGAGEAKFLTALDGRVKAAVLACGVTSFNALFKNEGWVPTLSGMIIYPELGLGSPEIGRLTSRQFQENLDKLKPEHHLQARKIFNDLFPFFEDLDPLRVVPLIAPAPLLIVSGTEDEQFSIPGVVDVDSVAAEEYRKYGMLSGFEFYPEPRAGHWVSDKAGYVIGAFFKRWLD